MGVRDNDDARTSHYAVLGVSRGASAEAIKRAYRERAKAAHPDAGGSVSAMARVNEAYATLVDPVSRRAYDATQTSSPGRTASGPAATGPTAPRRPAATTPAEDVPVTHPRGAEPFDARQPEHVARSRAAWARASAWELMRFALPGTILAMVLKYYFSGVIAGFNFALAFDLITFIPVYFFILSILFLADPPLRLVFADLARRHPTTRRERRAAAVLVLAFIPLGLIWVAWQ